MRSNNFIQSLHKHTYTYRQSHATFLDKHANSLGGGRCLYGRDQEDGPSESWLLGGICAQAGVHSAFYIAYPHQYAAWCTLRLVLCWLLYVVLVLFVVSAYCGLNNGTQGGWSGCCVCGFMEPRWMDGWPNVLNSMKKHIYFDAKIIEFAVIMCVIV